MNTVKSVSKRNEYSQICKEMNTVKSVSKGN